MGSKLRRWQAPLLFIASLAAPRPRAPAREAAAKASLHRAVAYRRPTAESACEGLPLENSQSQGPSGSLKGPGPGRRHFTRALVLADNFPVETFGPVVFVLFLLVGWASVFALAALALAQWLKQKYMLDNGPW